jgi:hypothetical protein
MQSADATIKSLREEVDTLKERVRQLEDICREPRPLPRRLGLSKREDEVVRILLKMGAVSHEAMTTILCPDTSPGYDYGKFFVCKARIKLKKFGITIDTRWGWGYEMSAEARAKLRAVEVSAGG